MPAPAAQAQKPLIRDVLLRDGMTLRLQAPTPADYEDIKTFYDGLLPDSRYLRLHGFGRTDIIARADAEASGVDRLALIARHDGRLVAAACYVGLREPGVAEVAMQSGRQWPFKPATKNGIPVDAQMQAWVDFRRN